MATENQVETTNDSTEETSDQAVEKDQQQEQQPANGEQQAQQQSNDRLPDDHPLVKAYASSQAELKQLRTSQTTKVTELEQKLAEATAEKEAATQTQAKYARLEEFLTKAGGPLARVLDSKSFTTALFETDADVQQILTDWHKANPSATSEALGSGAADPAGKKPGLNDLLRAAAK